MKLNIKDYNTIMDALRLLAMTEATRPKPSIRKLNRIKKAEEALDALELIN